MSVEEILLPEACHSCACYECPAYGNCPYCEGLACPGEYNFTCVGFESCPYSSDEQEER